MEASPSTVSEATGLLARDGYTADFDHLLSDDMPPDDGHRHDPAGLVIERQYRFEGDSNPGDEAIVLGVQCPACGARGVVVSAYGPEADPVLLAKLHDRR